MGCSEDSIWCATMWVWRVGNVHHPIALSGQSVHSVTSYTSYETAAGQPTVSALARNICDEIITSFSQRMRAKCQTIQSFSTGWRQKLGELFSSTILSQQASIRCNSLCWLRRLTKSRRQLASFARNPLSSLFSFSTNSLGYKSGFGLFVSSSGNLRFIDISIVLVDTDLMLADNGKSL